MVFDRAQESLKHVQGLMAVARLQEIGGFDINRAQTCKQLALKCSRLMVSSSRVAQKTTQYVGEHKMVINDKVLCPPVQDTITGCATLINTSWVLKPIINVAQRGTLFDSMETSTKEVDCTLIEQLRFCCLIEKVRNNGTAMELTLMLLC